MIEKEELALKIEEINQKLKSVLSECSRLQKDPIVERYLALEKEIDYLSTEKHHFRVAFEQLKYEACNHPLWYFLKSTHDFSKGDINWTCQCLKCGYVQRDKNYFFWNKVILQSILLGHGRKSQHSYKTVSEAYQKCVETEPNNNINKSLIKKYITK